MSLTKEIYEAKKLISETHFYEEFPLSFSKYSPAYVGTNERIKELFDIVDVRNKDILCPTSSGDFALNCLACGAKSVTTFDQDVFAKHILYLKIAASITYPEIDDFKKFFTIINNGGENPDIFSREMFYKISDNLAEDSFTWWKNAYDNSDNLYETALFRGKFYQTAVLQEKYNIYFDDEKYQFLRERLKNTNIGIDVHDLSLTELPTLQSIKEFDFAYLSNILQYYKDIPELDNPSKVHQFIQEKIAPLLSKKGEIGVCYSYGGRIWDEKEYICNCLMNQFSHFYRLEYFGLDSSPGMEDAIVLYKK